MSLLDNRVTVRIMWCGIGWPITSLDGGIVVKSRSTVLCNGIAIVTFIEFIAMLVGINSIRLIRTEKSVIRWFWSSLRCCGCCSRCCSWWFSCIAFRCSCCWLKMLLMSHHLDPKRYLPLWLALELHLSQLFQHLHNRRIPLEVHVQFQSHSHHCPKCWPCDSAIEAHNDHIEYQERPN